LYLKFKLKNDGTCAFQLAQGNTGNLHLRGANGSWIEKIEA
jgi:hypothetical protein